VVGAIVSFCSSLGLAFCCFVGSGLTLAFIYFGGSGFVSLTERSFLPSAAFCASKR